VPQYSTTASNDSGQYQNTEDLHWYTVDTNVRKKQEGVEVRLNSDPDFSFEWIVGYAFYKDRSARYTTWSDPDQEPGSTTYTQDNKAVFANVKYPITDKFRGSVGYRRSWDEVGSVSIPAKAGGFAAPVSYSNPDYSVGAEYDLTPDSMLYANYATSYRMNALKITQAKDVGPEKMTAYTVGVKNRFLENKLQLNADVYYYDYKNKNSRVTNDGRLNAKPFTVWSSWITGPDGVTPYSDILGEDRALSGPGYGQDPWVSQGSGEFTTIGADISADWILTNNDKLNVSLAYIDSKWEDMLIQFYWKNWTAAGTAATGLTGHVWADEGKNLAGRQVTYSPTWSGTLGYEHSLELGDFGFLVPHIDILYKSDYVLDYEDIYAPYDRQEAYYMINANARFSHMSGKWSLDAYVRNATNYAAKTFWMKRAGVFGLGISNPRTYGLVVSLKY
jgi:iron complex outermembrane receptor protein